MTSGGTSFARLVCARDKAQTPISELGRNLEPAPPAPITPAAENHQCDENDQEGCRVHVALLWTRESSPSSLHAISRRELGEIDSLGIYSTRHELSLVASYLEKGQHAQQHANMKGDEHADAQQEREGPNHGGLPNESSGCRRHASLVTAARNCP
jgi:hypothetical protein